ncbi:MAG: aquaporin [Myxococcota bacterium]
MIAPLSRTLRTRWPEALIEAGGLGLFMISAIGFTILLEHPLSPAHAALPNADLRRALMGCAMGATLIALVYSPFGARSGAHFNPVFTLTFWRLDRIEGGTALLYGAAQFVGAVAGVALLSALVPSLASDPSVRHAITLPGARGVAAAFAAEVAIAFVQMSIVLAVSNSRRLHAWTGVFAAVGVAVYIAFEAPISGMSMNPARSLGSAVGEACYASIWLYFAAPLVGMGLAAEVYVRRAGLARVFCAKLNHTGSGPCPFRCRHAELMREADGRAG